MADSKLIKYGKSHLSRVLPARTGRSDAMRRYHHLGIPTTESRKNETYLPHLKMHVSGFQESEYGIEWMRFDDDCPLPDLVRKVPHVAFEVDDLQAEISGKRVLIPPNSPSPGVVVAFIVENDAPVEFLQIDPEPPADHPHRR